MSSTLEYAIVTAARNEEACIRQTIECMIAQTVPPVRWIIVSDGSTDGTDDIIAEYSSTCSWIGFVRMPAHSGYSFASKANCFNAGLKELRDEAFDIIGNLDADLTFDAEYFEFLLSKFASCPRLGVAGTPFAEPGGGTYDYRFTSIDHVSGACQLFRRECFESIGGYVAVPEGGIDWIAVTTARMNGWTTRTFTEKTLIHHRKMGTGGQRASGTRFRMGMKDYNRGNGFSWEVFRCIYQMRHRPFVVGGAAMLLGFLWATLRHRPRPITKELMRFSRQEQAERLRMRFSLRGPR
jgi:biofilm PGA synthesis N-glycosyltransferase PgaC